MRIIVSAGLAALLMLAACAGGAEDDDAAEQAQTRGDWPAFVDATLEQWFRIDPAFAVYQGRHDFDGQLPDWSEAGLRRRADFLNDTIRRARAFGGLTGDAAFERDYMIQVARGQLFWLTDADQPHRNPAFYVGGGLDPNVYVARPYAAPAVRMRAAIAFLKNVPDAAQRIRANLRGPMPESFVDYGIAAFDGFAAYYRSDLPRAFAGVGTGEQQRALAEGAARASEAMAGLASSLREGRATATHDFALGPERFARMLDATEAVDTPLGALEAAGRADLDRNRAALAAACRRYAPGIGIAACIERINALKPEGGPVAGARRQLPELRAFIVAHDLVTIPAADTAQVAESPPYNRQNAAYIDPPGPYQRGVPAIYYIAPPDPAWPAAMQRDFVPGEPDLLFTSAHEVWPGHFLQFLHSNRARSSVGRVFVGYAFAEGWSHYAEEMVLEAGLRDSDPTAEIGQLSNALLRDCRFLSAIGLHARGMTQAESERMFRDECFQDAGNARQQAARGTYYPAYLNYTLGKLMIRRLRDDWT